NRTQQGGAQCFRDAQAAGEEGDEAKERGGGVDKGGLLEQQQAGRLAQSYQDQKESQALAAPRDDANQRGDQQDRPAQQQGAALVEAAQVLPKAPDERQSLGPAELPQRERAVLRHHNRQQAEH